jgi:hypothetical protein
MPLVDVSNTRPGESGRGVADGPGLGLPAGPCVRLGAGPGRVKPARAVHGRRRWGTASPAEAIRARPATVATAQAGLWRSTDAIGDRLRCPVGMLVRAENRDGLRCRADTRDTCGPSIWGAISRSPVTRMLAQACPAASGVRTPRGSGRRDHQQRWSSSRTLGAAVDQPAPHGGHDAANPLKWPKMIPGRAGSGSAVRWPVKAREIDVA